MVKPRVVVLYLLDVDRAGKARCAYVDPHVVRIWEKVLELSGGEPDGAACACTREGTGADGSEQQDATMEAVTTW